MSNAETLSLEESQTGVGVDRAAINAVRAHCVMDWDAVVTATHHQHGILFNYSDEVVLDDERLALFLAAVQEMAASR